MPSEDFPALYDRHVRYVLTGDVEAALRDMVPARLPAVFKGVTVPRGQVDGLRVLAVRREGETWVGETVYDIPGGPIGLRSIWIQLDGEWKADALENFAVPMEVGG
jgi:hypothetical protein